MHGRILNRFFPVCLLFAAMAASTAVTTARAADLTTWTNQELTPYVINQLTTHPRFKGETFVFVALSAGAPAPLTNALALALRDRLVAAVADQPGVSLAMRSGRDDTGSELAGIDCARDRAHYFVGIEVNRLIDRRHRITMRVLDAEDGSWVAGASKTWEGNLTPAQRRASEQAMTDEYFRGHRDAPFEASQADMLAAHLAHELACNLLRQVDGEYVIVADPTPGTPIPARDTVELVGNNLAGNAALQITSHASAANATLTGKAHRITGDLYQFWVTVAPAIESTRLSTVSASAYVRLPDAPRRPDPANDMAKVATGAPFAASPVASLAGTENVALIAPLRVVAPRQPSACYRGGSSAWKRQLIAADHTVARGECFLLQTRADRDATVFLLNYQVNHGLVRLSGDHCGHTTAGRAVRAGERLQFPDHADGRPSASAWQGQQGLESFYAVAVSNPNAAREVAAVIRQLPSRCTLTAVDGATGARLQAWLQSFGDVTDRWQHSIDWQAVRVEHVF